LSGEKGEPLQFFSEIQDVVNVLMFYEDVAYARLLESVFLRRGADLGHACLYVSSDNKDMILQSMRDQNVDADRLAKMGLFHTVFFDRLTGHVVDMVDRFADELRKKKKTARVVVRFDSPNAVQESDLLHLEQFFLQLSAKYDFSILSSYGADLVGDNKKGKLIRDNIGMHSHVVFAPSFGYGLVVKIQ